MRIAAVTAAALALTFAGCGGSKAPDVRLTAHGSKSEVEIGDRVTISGVVRRDGRAAAMGLELRASSAPLYSSNRRVARTRSDSHGQFGFVVRPRINTAYTIATTGATRHVVVFTAPRYKLAYTRVGGDAIHLAFTVDHPVELEPAAQRVYFYAAPKDVGKLVRLGSSMLLATSATRAQATGTFSGAPRGTIDAFACLPGMIAKGYGSPPIKGCGRPLLAR
jgi:hypothetical protein